MREFHNENTLYELIYCGSCKYKWTVEESKKINGKWTKTGKYKRFYTLDDAKKYALDKLNKTRPLENSRNTKK